MVSKVLKPEEMATPAPGARKRAALNTGGRQDDFPSAQEYGDEESESEADAYFEEDKEREKGESVKNTEDEELDRMADEDFDDDIEDEYYPKEETEDDSGES